MRKLEYAVCPFCKQEKHRSEFKKLAGKGNSGSVRIGAGCQDCRQARTIPKKEFRVCKRCGVQKELALFKGKGEVCFDCRNNKTEKIKPKSNKQLQLEAAQALYSKGYKVCSNCKAIKELDKFAGNKNSRDGKQTWCQQCMNKKRQEWADNNPNRDKELKEKFKQTDKYTIGRKNLKYKRREKLNQTPKEFRLTAKQWKDILNNYNHKCLSCGTTEYITVDHIKPLSMGGLNTVDNVQPLCHTCNSLKRDLEIDYRPEFLLLPSDYEHDYQAQPI